MDLSAHTHAHTHTHARTHTHRPVVSKEAEDGLVGTSEVKPIHSLHHLLLLHAELVLFHHHELLLEPAQTTHVSKENYRGAKETYYMRTFESLPADHNPLRGPQLPVRLHPPVCVCV
jgi:hypothetical protein